MYAQEEPNADERAQRRIVLYSVPVGSLFGGPEPESGTMYEALDILPSEVRQMVSAMRTGAYTRGLARNYKLPIERSAPVAFNIMRIALGNRTLEQLSGSLAADLSLPEERAKQMAVEIERDLFVPLKSSLAQFWEQQKRQPPTKTTATSIAPAPPTPTAAGPVQKSPNVLDLNQQKQPPRPPDIT